VASRGGIGNVKEMEEEAAAKQDCIGGEGRNRARERWLITRFGGEKIEEGGWTKE
jgi:hypothetical protein